MLFGFRFCDGLAHRRGSDCNNPAAPTQLDMQRCRLPLSLTRRTCFECGIRPARFIAAVAWMAVWLVRFSILVLNHARECMAVRGTPKAQTGSESTASPRLRAEEAHVANVFAPRRCIDGACTLTIGPAVEGRDDVGIDVESA